MLSPVDHRPLDLVGHELSLLATQVHGLQDALGPALVSLAHADATMVTSFQCLDHVEQVLTNLAGLLGAVSGRAPTGWQEALRRVSMADLRRRLGCRETGPSAETLPSECELF